LIHTSLFLIWVHFLSCHQLYLKWLVLTRAWQSMINFLFQFITFVWTKQ
jgi:hypothetical protein